MRKQIVGNYLEHFITQIRQKIAWIKLVQFGIPFSRIVVNLFPEVAEKIFLGVQKE